MNDFYLYEKLCEMSKIAVYYKDGEELGEKIRECADRTASRVYRTAVIGEFNRGKSSMINALLGTDVLPTSVLPMTAVITRVLYGEKRIVIKYKDGGEQEADTEQLKDFATKLDAETQRRASEIKEILVYYPSVFCQNHIELIDTPGLNDSDDMTSVTLSVLGNIDTAIMIVSATMPLSLSEQELVIKAIGEQGIHHIIFVITHIDDVEPEERDAVAEFIKKRIMGDFMERAMERFGDNELLREKAVRILKDPKIYGVSSKLAIQGFMHDSEKMLNESRFPYFKSELYSFLTSAQSSDIKLNAEDYFREISSHISVWYENEKKYLSDEKTNILTLQARFEQYFKKCPKSYSDIFKRMWSDIYSRLGMNNYKIWLNDKSLNAFFIKELYTVKTYNNTHENILSALRRALDQSNDKMSENMKFYSGQVMESMRKYYDEFINLRPFYEASETEINYCLALREKLEKWFASNTFPRFEWCVSPIPELDDLVNVNVIEHINSAIYNSLKKYEEEVKAYVLSWETLLREHSRILIRSTSVMNELSDALKKIDFKKIESKLSAIDVIYSNHLEILKNMESSLLSE